MKHTRHTQHVNGDAERVQGQHVHRAILKMVAGRAVTHFLNGKGRYRFPLLQTQLFLVFR